ncbi:MAG: RagB/SusD family nutrient uptake outer membrane protein [Prevotellaceae bacterium]|jgi:hypothetical protein|nr:RagB/SusD family nutrient uptake outer membrane protein [Prevotellaceae bacterium]
MKKIVHIAVGFAAIGCCSCDKFLDVAPDNRTSLASPAAVQELLVTAYPDMQYFHVLETMSDNASERRVSPSHTRQLLLESMYKWEDGDLAGTGYDTPSNIWYGCYKAIASANQALEAIAAAPDPERYSAQKGEALVCRAFAHFMLVNIFAEHYSPATANSAPGVPYMLAPEKIAAPDYTRRSVQEVYDLVEQDLQAGLHLIDDAVYTVPKYHFTKAAAHAFAARFYLYKGGESGGSVWDSVIVHATAAMGDGSIAEKLLPLDDSAQFVNASYDEYKINYRDVKQPNILLLVGSYSYWASDHINGNLPYGMMREHSDNLFYAENVAGTKGSSGIFYKTWFTSASTAGFLSKYNSYSTRTLGAWLTVEDALLMRAEAYAMKKEYGLAIADVDIFLSKRLKGGANITSKAAEKGETAIETIAGFYTDNKLQYPAMQPHYALDSDGYQIPLLKCIVGWRRLEFFQEGLRWFDVKRFHIPVTHKFPYTMQPTVTLTDNDPRRALQIPSDAQPYGIGKNPREGNFEF